MEGRRRIAEPRSQPSSQWWASWARLDTPHRTSGRRPTLAVHGSQNQTSEAKALPEPGLWTHRDQALLQALF